ncbi:asparagine--tRNA ligase [candidate division KSB1 bacterium]|nr:asparagine--tRNA ligase [candidate division KSB1 bacterium]
MSFFDRKSIRQLFEQRPTNETLTVRGWVRTVRASKNVTFIELNDGSTLTNLQIVIGAGEAEKIQNLKYVQTGASLIVTGKITHSQAKGQPIEMIPEQLEIAGEALPEYPLQKKRHSFEYLREIAHLRPRTNTFGVMNRFRSKIAWCIHEFFRAHDFYYIHSPIISNNDAEGAGEVFHVSTFSPYETSPRKPDPVNDFFGLPTVLTVTGQLQAEALALALGNVYTFGPTFRAENSNTARHLSEFWMIEPEMAFADLDDDLEVIEAFVRAQCRFALDECTEEMAFFDQWIAKGRLELIRKIADSKFQRITYTEAIDILSKATVTFEQKPEWGMDLKTEHERFLAEKHFNGPVFVTDYPFELKAFYMKVNDDRKTVAAVDLLVPEVGEIVGGSQREHRYDMLIESMEKKHVPCDVLEWYLDLRKDTTTPHAGFGLGFERMLMYLSGMQNIRDVIPFPRTPKNCKF